MTFKTTSRALSAGLIALGLSFGVAHAAYPEKPIQLIVPWSAGGGTDAIARQLASGLQEQLGQPVNVVNRTGGGGIVGHTTMAMAEPDGYTLGLVTAEISTYRNIGTSDISYEDLTPIAMINFDSAAFNVGAESEWDTLDQALADIKANPGEYTVSGSGPGAAYHLAFSGFLDQQGIDPTSVALVPSEGAAPGFQELAAGGVDIVFSSLPEAESMRKAGRVDTLAVFSEERLEAFPDVPTAEELTGQPWAAGTWRGLAGPKGLPEDIVETLAEATHKVWESEQFQSFMEQRGFGTQWRGPQAFGEFMAQEDEQNGKIIDKLGLAQ
ncbi:Tripartite-type tricarboxylate transporter, receptor component TctC [Modicisalibacter muralis]|uniref:Tripartite-type tricarboxylate transporter, receptor component TctC n=1 Tax=Modicisalibacter muralis TaxID=119000 RepID=A0A1G9IMC1_9GAMM|nr:tripartite tricarboxylate transporter substrate binding protein [Halomonas muralis]SDL26280.1 Tripartite-type tricarboxylate transporter, receptor component TctC [Halomonas muralis]